MAYVPDPTDVTQPIESVFANTAAAEFRALKAYIQGLVVGGGQLSGNRSFTRNGDFLLNQRGAVASAVDASYPVDGWRLQNTGVNRVGAVRNTATFPDVFPQTLQLSINVAGAPAAGEVYGTYSAIEGYDVARLLYGTASARAFTHSFKVYSTQAGTFAFSVRNGAANRSYVTPITVNVPNTWETKTVTIPGDVAGAWNNTNGVGMQLGMHIAVGATYTTATPNTWLAGNFVGLTTMTNFVGALGSIYFAEVQDEQGSFANAFEYLPFPLALVKAQRYWQSSYEYGVAPGTATGAGSAGDSRGIGNDGNNILVMRDLTPAVPMRANPSYVIYNPGTGAAQSLRNTQTGANIALSVGTTANTKGAYILTAAGLIVAGQLYEWHTVADADI